MVDRHRFCPQLIRVRPCLSRLSGIECGRSGQARRMGDTLIGAGRRNEAKEVTMSFGIYESSPGPGFWRRDNAHFPVPMSLYLWELFVPAHHEGSRLGYERYGCAIDHFDFARIKGRMYGGARFVTSPDELERRREAADLAIQTKLWRQDRSHWRN